MKVVIYSKDNCSQCDMAIHKAQAMVQETNEHSYEVKKLGADFSREELMELFPTARTFPQIIVDDEKIGGWQEFQLI